MIADGGYVAVNGKQCGLGLFEHFMNARKLIWPERYRHKWTDLIYREILNNQVTILMGCASSQKTSHLAEFVLIDYWASPHNTCTLVSTTDRDKLEMAVFGEIKMLWQLGKQRFPWLAGHLIGYKQVIATDDISEDGIRDIRKGIVGRACFVGHQWVGLGSFAGIKQERFRFLADELQFMAPTFLGCLPNMFSNTGKGGLKVMGSGNTRHDPDDQLGIAAEPLEGWAAYGDLTKTTVWNTKFYRGRCINLIGTDSPNFDVPEGEPEPYYRLIGREFERIICHNYGKDSPEYETQVMGRMKLNLAHSRVITRQLCKDHHAHDKATWKGTDRTQVYYTDPAYGGGDRCTTGRAEFGESDSGGQILRVFAPRIVRINLADPRSPEDQIADSVKADLELYAINPQNAGYDSFGKGTIGYAYSRKMANRCPVPVDAGGMPTRRPVRADLFKKDEATGVKRLKRCDEHFSKFITEMWFAVRYVIEADQMRELPEDVMMEGCWREYYTVAGDKLEVEPKADMKERMGKSPDLFDWIAGIVEMARRAGFVIGKLGQIAVDVPEEPSWYDLEAAEYDKALKNMMLNHA